MRLKWRRVPILLLVALTASVQAGCKPRSSYQVSGKAQFKGGAPITGAVRIVRLEPTDDTTAAIRKPASGDIGPDGSFMLFTRKPGDGVIPGKYSVTFTVLDKPMGGNLLIPSKYTNGAESPFKIEVDGDKSDLLYELEKQ